MKLTFKNNIKENDMIVNHMNKEEVIKMFGNRIVERLDKNGDTEDFVFLYKIDDIEIENKYKI